MARDTLKAPFPWFGGKSRVAHIVWDRFGPDVPNYVEPFFGSGAVLLARPGGAGKIETVNDIDGYVANFWRAVQYAPDEVARYADWPVNENDLHARHVWLRQFKSELPRRLEADPEYYDVKVAGWWVWGVSCWIGGGFCTDAGAGPWVVQDGMLVNGVAAFGVCRKRPHLGDNGRGVHAGVGRCLPHLSDRGQGVHASGAQPLVEWMRALSDRLRRARVCCGDFERVLGASPTIKNGTTAVFLDPPYSADGMDIGGVYAEDGADIAARAREWAFAHGDDPRYRIALCGYDGEHAMPDSWECVPWRANGGFAGQRKSGENTNRYRERIWFSPHCLRPATILGTEWGRAA